MPSAENQYIQGNESLKDVIDGYNDPWLKTEPIYGPKPQPDHARGLKWSTFSESQRRKLGIKPDEKSPYTAREDMYFPYLTAEIKCGNQALELADRQNMHSMCIALRAVVSLCQAAGCTGEVHRRILGFSVSHELEGVRLYGYYPEIDGGKVSFYRWPVAQPNIWTKEDRWTCYRFVENVDREFLPIHTHRLLRILEGVPDPDEGSLSVVVDEPDSQLSMGGSQERLGYRRVASSQNRGLQPELRMMVQTLQEQLAEQKDREEKREAEQKAREEKLLAQLEQQKLREEKREAEQKAWEAEQKAREEKLLAQLEQQKLREEQREMEQKAQGEKREAEQKAREEKLLAQLEQQKLREEKREAEQKAREEKREAEQKELQMKLLALLEQKDNSK
jgi:flagellar biosynthesis GTPase FlhF